MIMDFKKFRCLYLDMCEDFNEYPEEEEENKPKTFTQDI